MPKTIETESNDTTHDELAGIDPWGDEYDSTEIPWCLYTSLLEKNEGDEFSAVAGEPLSTTFQKRVLANLRAALTDNSCATLPAKYAVEADWDVVVNRSQPDGDLWQPGSSAFYAHPLFRESGTWRVAVSRPATGENLESADITYS